MLLYSCWLAISILVTQFQCNNLLVYFTFSNYPFYMFANIFTLTVQTLSQRWRQSCWFCCYPHIPYLLNKLLLFSNSKNAHSKTFLFHNACSYSISGQLCTAKKRCNKKLSRFHQMLSHMIHLFTDLFIFSNFYCYFLRYHKNGVFLTLHSFFHLLLNTKVLPKSIIRYTYAHYHEQNLLKVSKTSLVYHKTLHNFIWWLVSYYHTIIPILFNEYFLITFKVRSDCYVLSNKFSLFN